jgi:hypothetical protein
MVKKYLSFIVCCLLLITANASFISAQTNTENKDSSIAKVKAKVVKRSTAKNTYIKVKMLDGKKLSGEINQAGEDSFTLTDSKTKQSTSIAYRDVAQVKGKGLSTTDKIAIGVLAGAAAIVLTIVLIPICNEGGC